MEDIQLRRVFLEDLCEAKSLDRALSRVAGGLKGDICWDRRDNLAVILRRLWRLDREESFVFIVLRKRRSQAKVDLEQRRLGLFGRHDEIVWK